MGIKVVNTEATKMNIRRMLKEKNMTPRYIQRRLNLDSIQAVYKWIGDSGKGIPSLDNLINLATILDCTLEDILVLNHVDI